MTFFQELFKLLSEVIMYLLLLSPLMPESFPIFVSLTYHN